MVGSARVLAIYATLQSGRGSVLAEFPVTVEHEADDQGERRRDGGKLGEPRNVTLHPCRLS
jgi:hypothetical protein